MKGGMIIMIEPISHIKIVIDEKTYCCGVPMITNLIYDMEEKERFILFKCKFCMTANRIKIKE